MTGESPIITSTHQARGIIVPTVLIKAEALAHLAATLQSCHLVPRHISAIKAILEEIQDEPRCLQKARNHNELLVHIAAHTRQKPDLVFWSRRLTSKPMCVIDLFSARLNTRMRASFVPSIISHLSYLYTGIKSGYVL